MKDSSGNQRPTVSRRAARFDSSGIRRVFELIRTLEDPINLSIGQPDFAMPEAARNAAHDAMMSGKNGYTVTQGIPELRSRISSDVQKQIGHNNRAFCITSGTSGALVLALMAIIDPGDEVIIFEPAFVMYRPLIEFLGGHCVAIDLSPTFEIDVDAVTSYIGPKTRAVLLNSPNNPTGKVVSSETLEQLAEVTDKHHVTLISDELYRGFCYDHPFTSAATFSKNSVILDGFSKSHAMTGWRVGYMHGPPDIIDACITLQQYTFVCSPQAGQWAALAAADCDMTESFDTCRKKRDRLVEGLRGHYDFTHPDGAFYLYPKAPGGSAEQFAERAVREEQLLIVAGTVFGSADSHFRISYTVSDTMLERGIEALIRLADKH